MDPKIPGITMCRISDDCAFMDIGIVSLRSRYWSQSDREFLEKLQAYCNDLDQVLHPYDEE